MVTGSPTDAREGIILLDDAQCLAIPAFGDQGDIPLGALPGRAAPPAGSDAELLDGVSCGDCLGVEAIGGFPLLQTLFIKVLDRNRATLGTISTPHALIDIDVARSAAQGHGEIARLPLDAQHIARRGEIA